MPNKTSKNVTSNSNKSANGSRGSSGGMASKSRNQNRQMRKGNNNRRRPARATQDIRTQSTIIRSLATQMRNTSLNQLPAYVACRINPFQKAKGQAGIPDGANKQYMLIDTRVVDTINCSQAKTSFVIQTLPCMPAGAMIAGLPSTTLNINGVNVTAPTHTRPDSAHIDNAWYPLSVPETYLLQGNYQPGFPTNDPYGASKARFVSIGYKLMYTGPTQTCSGSITVTPNDVGIATVAATTAYGEPTGPQFGLETVTASFNRDASCRSPQGTQLLGFDLNISPATMMSTSMTFRPEEGILILPRHKSNVHKLSPLVTTNYGAVAHFNNTGNLPSTWYNMLTMSDVNVAGSRYRGGILWYDDDWSSVQIYATGINADASFRFETVYCVEYTPQLGSPLADLSLQESIRDPAQIAMADKMLSNIPIAQSMAGRQ